MGVPGRRYGGEVAVSEKAKEYRRHADGKRIERKRAFGRDDRDALETQRRATSYGRARGLS